MSNLSSDPIVFNKKTPHNNKFKPIKLGMKKQGKFYIGFLWVADSMIVHIQDEKSPKEAWDTLLNMYNTNTQACKMQLKQELQNLQKKRWTSMTILQQWKTL